MRKMKDWRDIIKKVKKVLTGKMVTPLVVCALVLGS